jgi:hypothetical protein
MFVKSITRNECEPFILGIHYAKRWCSISYAFGLYQPIENDFMGRDELIGIVTYGTPPSSTLKSGIAGDEHKEKVLELNRLCLKYNRKNEASFLVGNSLKLLPKNRIVVSFADIEQGHNGCVYRATNFTYHGLSAKRKDWKVKGLEHLHGITIADQFRGVENRGKAIREHYGDDFYMQERPRKHRYIFVTGDKRQKKILKSAIKYPIEKFIKE